MYVTGGSKEKVSRAVEKLGAKGGAVYKDKDWAKQIAALLPKDRPYLDVVLDSAGGDVSAQSIKAGLKTGGKVVCFGMTAKPQIPVTMREVLKNVDVLGESLLQAKGGFEPSIGQACIEKQPAEQLLLFPPLR